MSEVTPEALADETPTEPAPSEPAPAEEVPAEEVPAVPTATEVFDGIVQEAREAYLNRLKDLLFIAMDARRIDDVKFLLDEVDREGLRLQQSSTVFPAPLVEIFVKGLV